MKKTNLISTLTMMVLTVLFLTTSVLAQNEPKQEKKQIKEQVQNEVKTQTQTERTKPVEE